MKIHEYQARQFLADFGIPVPPGRMVETVADAAAEARALFASGVGIVVVKAQVHAGGRGKAGFVKVCKTAEEAEVAAKFMLSHRMVSPQTPAEGLEVKRILVAAGVDIAKEYYLAIVMDRTRHTNTLIASAEGGVEIEHIAETRPDAIIKVALDPLTGLAAFQARMITRVFSATDGNAHSIRPSLNSIVLCKNGSVGNPQSGSGTK
jgi:succinyl-CoA synthetase beta subunit